MVAILGEALRRKRWVPGPQARIDWSHPLARGLMFCFVNGRDIAAGLPLTQVGTPARNAPTVFGRGVNHNANQTGYSATLGTAHRLSLQPPLSVVWVGSRVGVPTVSSTILGVDYNNAGGDPYGCFELAYGSNANTFQLFWNNAGTFAVTAMSSSGDYTALGAPSTLVATIRSGSQVLYSNGVPIISGTASISSISYGAASTLGVGYYGGVSRNPNMITNIGLIYGRGLSAREAVLISADPSAMFYDPGDPTRFFNGFAPAASSSLLTSSGFFA